MTRGRLETNAGPSTHAAGRSKGACRQDPFEWDAQSPKSALGRTSFRASSEKFASRKGKRSHIR